MFSQNFSIIGFATRELHLPEVEVVELYVFLLKSSQNSLLFRGIILDLKNRNLQYFVTLLFKRLAFQKFNAC
jgi:hypothetical protein